jgi:hypothetical protein
MVILRAIGAVYCVRVPVCPDDRAMSRVRGGISGHGHGDSVIEQSRGA